MSADVDDISINYEEDGTLIVKELDKEILSKGAWTTILFAIRTTTAPRESTDPISIPSAGIRNETVSICPNQNSTFPVLNRPKKLLIP
jgi:hypothetical protein